MTAAGWGDELRRHAYHPAPVDDDGSLHAAMSNLAHYRAVADVMARHQDLCMALTAHRRARTVVIELGIVCILLVISMVIFAMPVLALPVIPLVGVAFLIGHRIDVSAEYGDDLQVELARTRAELAALSRGGNGVDNTGGN